MDPTYNGGRKVKRIEEIDERTMRDTVESFFNVDEYSTHGNTGVK